MDQLQEKPIDTVKSDNTLKYVKDEYSDVLEYSFSDLQRFAKDEYGIFEELYYNREHEFNDFHLTAKNLHRNGNNILVVGKAGIGKSNYVYRLFYNKELLEECNLYPLMIDYTKIGSENDKDFWKLHLIDSFDQYFKKEVNDFTLNLRENTMANISDNLYKIQKNIIELPIKRVKKHLILFIDDLDYAEESNLFDILDVISPFARSERVSVLLSVRPPLLHSIQSNDFKYQFLFTTNVKKIELAPLHIQNVLSMRLAVIMILPNKHILLDKLKKIKSDNSKFKSLLNKLGVHNLQNLKEFEYPFTDAYANFMSKITDGNLREVFAIAMDSMMFIFDNYDKLESVIENDVTKKIISEENIVEILYKNQNSKYKLFNLHQIINSKGNSLHFNVIEAVQSFECTSNNGFYESLKRLGHERIDVDNAIKFLALKEHRFIVSNYYKYIKDDVKEIERYGITEKGRYYLSDVTKWNEYIQVCKSSNQSIIQQIKNEP